jgi:DNA-binding IclR family transcriptional regulator
MQKKFIPIIDLIKEIRTDLEGNRGFRIDKKTVRRIVDHLEQEGLVVTKDIRVTYSLEREESESQNSEDDAMPFGAARDLKERIVPIVHAPDYTVTGAEVQ